MCTSDSAPESANDQDRLTNGLGERLVRQERRLRLLLYHFTGAAVRARVEVDDLIQEVYVRALGAQSLPPLAADDPSDTELWRLLRHLARHTVIDAARAIRAAKRAGQTARLQHSAWSSAGPRASQILAMTRGPATRVIAAEAEERLEARFRGLSAEHQRVIGLRQFEGLSARETAGRMGRGETAIHSLYRRALTAWQGDEVFDGSRGESDPA